MRAFFHFDYDTEGMHPIAAAWTHCQKIRVLMLRGKGDAQTIEYLASQQKVFERRERGNSYILTLVRLYMAGLLFNEGREAEAWGIFKLAADFLAADRLYLIFANFHLFLPKLVDRYQQTQDQAFKRALARMKKPYTARRRSLHEAFASEQIMGMLTPREREVSELAVQGHSNAEIAHKLGVSEDTIKTHIKHVLAKMKQDRRTQFSELLD